MARTRRLPPLNGLRVLEAIRETGSVTAAAKRLTVSHSAVSHHVKQLEAWVGRPLFARRGRTIALTEAGESLAGVVHSSFDAIRHELDRLPIRFERSVSLSVLPIIAETVVLPQMHHFTTLHPGISLHISLAQTDRPKTPAPDIELLFSEHSRMLPEETVMLPGTAVPVAAPALLDRAGGDPVHLLEQGPFIADEDFRMWQRWRDLAADQITPSDYAPQLILEGSFLLQKAALNGLGAAICRTATIQADLDRGALVRLSEIRIDENWSYTLRLAPQRANEPAVWAVRDWLISLSTGQAGDTGLVAE
ncbi:LysR family transcriptional regulator [Rhodophyticola sp. CCM32]|uniref:LysR family transcriptional regulator n=1 Tax=Rhodophyticola sp. CCM32 TaxID=2916397 RepID=UPI00107F4E3B|nr:LysR family transcriptional regulator [Rhodophyticola sp. CCM32]QBX99339.1 LysR family transcriptional regulator [Rhodophyticola sp. CCM32]